MKNLYLKIKNFFASINVNINLVLIILVVIGGIFITMRITKSIERQKALEAEKARIELVTESLKRSNISQDKIDSLNRSVDDYYKEISKTENIDWTPLFLSPADSIAKQISEWDNRNNGKPKGK